MVDPKVIKSIGVALAGAAGAIAIVVGFEGQVNTTYKDPVNISTDCFGHTGPDVGKVGTKHTDQECLNLLTVDLVHTATDIGPCIHVPVPPTTMSAFVSFSYNAGAKAFCTSTMDRKLNQYDYKGACAELSRWTRAGGRELPGLVARRRVERAYCEKGLLNDHPQ